MSYELSLIFKGYLWWITLLTSDFSSPLVPGEDPGRNQRSVALERRLQGFPGGAAPGLHSADFSPGPPQSSFIVPIGASLR